MNKAQVVGTRYRIHFSVYVHEDSVHSLRGDGGVGCPR